MRSLSTAVLLIAAGAISLADEPRTVNDGQSPLTAPSETAQDGTETASPAIPVEIVPLVTLQRGSDATLTFAFRNNTETPIKYFPEHRHGLAWLHVRVIDERGKHVQYSAYWENVPVSEADLQTLAPGDSIDIRVSLDDYRFEGPDGKPPLGRYELRAVSRGRTEYGSTPIPLNETIMLIDFVERRQDGKGWVWADEYKLDLRELVPEEYDPIFLELLDSDKLSKEARSIAGRILTALRKLQREGKESQPQPGDSQGAEDE